LRSVLHLLPRFDGLVFTCNNTYRDVRTDVWLACDPAWHNHYGQVKGDFDKWHWDAGICSAYKYSWIEGVWHESKEGPARLWLKDKTKITLGHCSGVQLLNLCLNQYGCTEAVLIGHDFRYPMGQPRHYFAGLSSDAGEYPEAIRKHSAFDKGPGQYDLMDVYEELARTEGIPPVWNATEGSALIAFPYRPLEDFLGA
jgi:hypothetical protein